MQLTALDGSKWNIPVEVIARDHAAYYAPIEFDGDVERSLRDGTMPIFADDEFEVREWASNNMNWSDVKAHAVLVSGPEPVNMEDSWMEGEKRVIDVPEAAGYAGSGLPKLKADSVTIDAPGTSVFAEVTIANLRPSAVFRVSTEQPQTLFAIHNDGRVEFGEGVTLDEAARAFWDNVKLMGERMGINVGGAQASIAMAGPDDLVFITPPDSVRAEDMHMWRDSFRQVAREEGALGRITLLVPGTKVTISKPGDMVFVDGTVEFAGDCEPAQAVAAGPDAQGSAQ
ncbi:hypothetical protein POK33_38085 [Burkholderia cenocepacia]|nr:hypothetical protein [Burkholderia cenocepacia]